MAACARRFFFGSVGLSQTTLYEFNTLRLLTFNLTSKIAWKLLAAWIQLDGGCRTVKWIENWKYYGIEYIRTTLIKLRLPKKNFRAHFAMLVKVQSTYCFLLFFYSSPTTVLRNLSRLVLQRDFWLNIKIKKFYGIEYIRTTLTKPRLPKKNLRAHAAMLFKVQPTYCFLLFFYSGSDKIPPKL